MKVFVILFVASVLCYAYKSDHISDCLVYYNQPLATLSYVAIILSAIFVAYQAYLFRRDYETRKERSEFDMAYKLAGYYAKQILPNTRFANEILSEINLKIDRDFYKKSNLFVNFTSTEAQQIFGGDVIEKFLKELGNLDQNKLCFYEHLRTKIPRIKLTKDWDDVLRSQSAQSKNKKCSIVKDPGIELFYKDKRIELVNDIFKVLNDFEYFAMYFCSGLAAPDNVYMSIHQTYLEFITNNYLLICSQNEKLGHEYYTHAVKLYKNWNEISNKKDIERAEAFKKLTKPEEPKRLHS